MEYTHIQKNVQNSPRKVRLVADMVRRMDPDQAVEVLEFTQKNAALPLLKAIKTAMANASGKEGLSFKKLEVNEGMKLKRYKVGTAGRGRGRPFQRRWSHIKIVLTDGIQHQERRVSQSTSNNSKDNMQVQKTKGGNSSL